jgi:HD-GYP domain-containing protein (c-di-GMP phosphodiesterase class II)
MRLINLQETDEGMILGKSLYEANGKLLLGAGYRISGEMKQKLLDRRYTHVYIMEEGTEDVIPEDVISEEIKLQARQKLSGKMEEIERQSKFRGVSIDKAKKLIEEGYLKDIQISFSMRSIVEEILKDISASGATFAKMVMIKSSDTYFLDHAINTTVLAILIGKKYRFSNEELKSLALGVFLHDIGKVILNQLRDDSNPQKMAELYKEHPTFGYLILNNSGSMVTPMETQTVNQHHEYQDGSGFPIGLTGQNQPPIKLAIRDSKVHIYRMAEICCLVNAFDNMVFNPLKQRQLSPSEAIKRIILDSDKLYNKHIVQTLLKIVPNYPVGVSIRVLDIVDPHLIGYQGVVAKINEKNINRPTIILTKDKFLKKIKPIVIDTAKFKHVELELML